MAIPFLRLFFEQYAYRSFFFKNLPVDLQLKQLKRFKRLKPLAIKTLQPHIPANPLK